MSGQDVANGEVLLDKLQEEAANRLAETSVAMWRVMYPFLDNPKGLRIVVKIDLYDAAADLQLRSEADSDKRQ